jgi:hypothetical protein
MEAAHAQNHTRIGQYRDFQVRWPERNTIRTRMRIIILDEGAAALCSGSGSVNSGSRVSCFGLIPDTNVTVRPMTAS